MVNNSLAKVPKKNFKFSVAIKSDAYKNMINNTLGDPNRAQRFIASISSAVGTNQQLQSCEAGSIISGALVGEALNLSPSPQLGQYYLVPYKNKARGCDVAQFQLGYKGYIQLAIRSGQYKKLNVLSVKQGELVKFDPMEEEIQANLIEDEEEREKAETIGYYAMFELVNGFRKAIYWSRKKMEAHAKKYSKAYNSDLKWNKAESFWSKDFDEMALKTMLRQLISKWGVMSIDMQTAMENDMAVISDDGKHEYVDTDSEDAPAAETDVPEEKSEPEPEQPQHDSIPEDDPLA